MKKSSASLLPLTLKDYRFILILKAENYGLLNLFKGFIFRGNDHVIYNILLCPLIVQQKKARYDIVDHPFDYADT